MGNYAFSVMLQDQKKQVFSYERSKAVPVAQHFARTAILQKPGWKAEQKAHCSLHFKACEQQRPAVAVILQEKPNEKDEQMNIQNM